MPPPLDSREAEWERILAEAGDVDGRLPPNVVASPHAIRHGSGEEVAWWRPGPADVIRHVGWRWLLLLPGAALLAGIVIFPRFWIFNPLIALEIKGLIFMGGVALAMAGYVFRRAVQARTEPFCIFCGYDLTGLPDHYRCPECGRPYTWRLIAEYRRDPQWFIDRYHAARNLPPRDVPFEAGTVRRKRRRDGT